MPEAYKQLRDITTMLEKHYRDVQDFEFTIQEGKLYMLQTRNGKRTGPAAVRIAVDMVEEGLITKKEAVLRVAPSQLDQLLHPVLDPVARKSLKKIATALPASPGAAVGMAAFSSEDAVELSKKGPVILVRKETTPDDIHGMDVSKGILTAVGGLTSHAAVVARGMGRPCVVGASSISVNEVTKEATITIDGQKMTVKEGDWISIDGFAGRSVSGPGQDQRARSEIALLRELHGLGRRVPGQVRRSRQCRHPARCQSSRGCSAPKASACAAPSTCSSPRTAYRTCRP